MLEIEQLIERARHDMQICNACRYCEGYCAVFPAMERRLSFASGDLHYLAHLCHQCGECFAACQYAPPHEFAVNVPHSLAELRAASISTHAWPQPLVRCLGVRGVSAAAWLALAGALLVALLVVLGGRVQALWQTMPGGDFYRVLPHGAMAALFGAVGLFVLVALAVGAWRYWRAVGESLPSLAAPGALAQALRDALTLKNLHGGQGGGGSGCADPDELAAAPATGRLRRLCHHLTLGGFALCFAATVLGTVYHYLLGWVAPYPLLSAPVLLGTLGGLALLVGPPGLLLLRWRSEAARQIASGLPPQPPEPDTGIAFVALLWWVSATGLALLAARESAALGLLLVVHLGAVLALFVTLPYGKFVHGIYRSAALLKHALEQRRPHEGVGGE